MSRSSAKARHLLSRKSYSRAEWARLPYLKTGAKGTHAGLGLGPTSPMYVLYASGMQAKTVRIDGCQAATNKLQE